MYVKHNITFREGSSQGRFDLTLGPKQTMGKAVESVLVSSQLPRGVLNVNLNTSQGTYTFDPVTKVTKTACLSIYTLDRMNKLRSNITNVKAFLHLVIFTKIMFS